jgi:hypothetical protein
VATASVSLLKVTVVAFRPLTQTARVSVAVPKPEPSMVTEVPTGLFTGDIESLVMLAQLISNQWLRDVVADRQCCLEARVVGQPSD